MADEIVEKELWDHYSELPNPAWYEYKNNKKMKGKIITEHGNMVIEFFEKDAPNTVNNFAKLALGGFYDGLKFHRVIPGFVAQGGCPQGTGSGGPGYEILCELEGGNQVHDKGVLSMAHAGRNTGGSQFFLVHSREATQHLDKNHTCFGKVVEGLEIIEKVQQGDKFSVQIEGVEDLEEIIVESRTKTGTF
jgi:peptidyl-prolyl cis-trans isomerase B (cyclophilin B)